MKKKKSKGFKRFELSKISDMMMLNQMKKKKREKAQAQHWGAR
jgi:hypothetical protein